MREKAFEQKKTKIKKKKKKVRHQHFLTFFSKLLEKNDKQLTFYEKIRRKGISLFFVFLTVMLFGRKKEDNKKSIESEK